MLSCAHCLTFPSHVGDHVNAPVLAYLRDRSAHDDLALDAGVQLAALAVVGEEGVQLGQQAHSPRT